jgi:hypothetical protein
LVVLRVDRFQQLDETGRAATLFGGLNRVIRSVAPRASKSRGAAVAVSRWSPPASHPLSYPDMIASTRVCQLGWAPALALLLSMLAACSQAPPPVAPAAAPPPPSIPSEYAALPDTLVCVIDRTATNGLADIPAKSGPSGPVVLIDNQIRPIAAIHPVNVIAGYAGREAWLTRGDPIIFSERRYLRTAGERRVARTLLSRAGEHLGILLFAGLDDPLPIDALYIPTAPGCIFQAYVREDLIRR